MSRAWWRSIETGKSFRSIDVDRASKGGRTGERLMPAPPLAVLGVGLVSGVGLTAEASCAAIRCGINNFQETRFIGRDGELAGGQRRRTGRAVARHHEAREDGGARDQLSASRPRTDEQAGADSCPGLHCRAGTTGAVRGSHRRDAGQDIERELGLRLHPHSRVIEQGRVGRRVALLQARRMLLGGRHRTGHRGRRGQLPDRRDAWPPMIGEDRLLRHDNSNGFIPGEAAGAVLLGGMGRGRRRRRCLVRGLGFAREPAPLGFRQAAAGRRVGPGDPGGARAKPRWRSRTAIIGSPT